PTLPCMTRRADPLKLYAAHRAGLFQRLVRKARIGEASAEQWIVAWESQARERELDGRTGEWWEPAWSWISEQRGVG
ncbi:MAG: hypothetical protein ACRDGI_02610, partial [Candidatus Limnocylindrales bacterium]